MQGSRNERARAHARLLLEAPISSDADISELEKRATEYLVEAGRRVSPAVGVTDVLDAIARDYFAHAIRKGQRRAR